MSAFLGLIRKETYHILRDRRTLAVLLLMPLVQVLLFGFGIRTDVEDIRVALVNPTPDATVHRLRATLAASDRFHVDRVLRSTDELAPLFQRGTIDQAIVVGSDFAADLRDGAGAEILLLTDAINPNIGRIKQDYARAVLSDYEEALGTSAGLGAGAATLPPFRVETRVRYNPTLESTYVFVPGLLAFVLILVSALMTSISIAREKETGTMETMLVSPLRQWQIVLGKVVPYLLLAFINALTVLAVADWVFDVPIRGDLWLLLGESLLFVVVALALGVLISTRTDSQRTAMMGALIGLMLPTTLLSGMIFPVESMPGWLQPVTHLVPAKWFVRIIRGLLLKGVGLGDLWLETLILGGMGLFFLLASALSFNVRLE
jgi:ABC-2 type transport system permease protein